MRIETDYLVVGAGATGLAFVDALVHRADVDVVVVDRRDRPGGHWLDAYPFVRLHQPSATYGVDSRELGTGRIDTAGPNAGFYELATGVEVARYFGAVLDEALIPSGRVRFFGSSEYLGADADGHHLRSLRTGGGTVVTVRRRLVDATYVSPTIPSRHVPPFVVDHGVRLVSPNGLAQLVDPAGRTTVIGSGKTAMDTCGWLLEQGVDPDRIRWIKPREPLLFNRAFTQPRELVASYVELQASLLRVAATAARPMDLALGLEAAGVFVRIHSDVEPTAFRGGTVSLPEVERLRQVTGVVRGGYVRRIGTERVWLDSGTIEALPGEVFVDCSARGVPTAPARQVFAPDRITLQFVTLGNATYSAATLGVVEALREEDAVKNLLCPPSSYDGRLAGYPGVVLPVLIGSARRAAEPDLDAWNGGSRMNPVRGAAARRHDPRIAAALDAIAAHGGAARGNLARLVEAEASRA